MVGRQVSFPEYVDWLETMRNLGGPMQWIAQQRHFPSSHSSQSSRSSEQILNDVLQSDRVTSVIRDESVRRGISQEIITKEAEKIAQEMGHKFGLGYVRTLGFAVAKVLETIFDSIYVNKGAVKKLRETVKETPIVFVPSHRTYLDFLLLSLVCFDAELTLPAIAAGQDFMQMAVMGSVLRRCGAFFIRRSFGNDKLYWAVFSEYVQTHVQNGDRPVEFFVEGTRSRVGKSLHPKYGMLQIAIEPFIRGQVYDMVLVPVSMNYDKILEETLYAYELLGFSKPKESTSGLFKAREILSKKFGKCFVTFGDPISMRESLGSSLLRSSFVCQPISQFKLGSEAKKSIRRLAHQIVRINDENQVITVWPLACTVMLWRLDNNDNASFGYSQLLQDVSNLFSLLQRIGVRVNIAESLDIDFRYYLNIHSDIFDHLSNEEDFELKLRDMPVERSGVLRKETMERAVTRLILTNYANVLSPAVIQESLICLIVDKVSKLSRQDILEEITFIEKVLNREFVFVPNQEKQDFEKSVRNLTRAQIMTANNGHLLAFDSEAISVLKNIVAPYLSQISITLSALMRNNSHSSQSWIQSTQKFIFNLYESNDSSLVRLSFLSTEPIKNTLSMLTDFNAIKKEGNTIHIESSIIEQIQFRLNRLVDNEKNSIKLYECKL